MGKSTLFNRLTGTRDALVADYPGLTRDRLYGFARLEGRSAAVVVDTGGLSGQDDAMSQLMARQVDFALAEANAVIFLVEAGAGLTAGDRVIAEQLRRSAKPVLLAVNKAEGLPAAETVADFWELGLGEPVAISAARGDRVNELLRAAIELSAAADPVAAAALDSSRAARWSAHCRGGAAQRRQVDTNQPLYRRRAPRRYR